MGAIEKNFKKWLKSQANFLNEDRIKHNSKGERPAHLRFARGSGIDSLDAFETFFKSLNFDLEPTEKFTGSLYYRGHGFYLNWQGNKVGVLLALSRSGLERKKLTPQNLGLNGRKFDNAEQLRNRIEQGLADVISDADFRRCLISMLDNIQSQSPIVSHSKLQQNINIISSDFGEVLSAYNSCLQGHYIEFPENSNNTVADYYESGVPISNKGINAGGKVNLKQYADMITRKSNVGRFLYALATHNKDDFCIYGAKICKEAAELEKLVGGLDQVSVKNFMAKNTYDSFYKYVDEKFNGYGKPLTTKDDRPRDLWDQGDTSPFYFTLNTIIHRFWGLKSGKDITKVIAGCVVDAKFIHVNIVDSMVVFKEVPFDSVAEWQTCYWGRATKPWHNWMAVEPKEK